jgi:hypothetical protein
MPHNPKFQILQHLFIHYIGTSGDRLHISAPACYGIEAIEGGLAVDFLANSAGRTDTLILAGVTVRSSLVVNENAIVDVEAGVRQRLGVQTVVFGEIGSQITGRSDRTQLRLRFGISHFF